MKPNDNDKIMKLTEHMVVPRRRGNRGSLVLGLLLLGAGYWITTQAIALYHVGIRTAVTWAIANDVAQTGLVKAEMSDRAMYSTAIKLDQCRDSLEEVRLAIVPLTTGAAQK